MQTQGKALFNLLKISWLDNPSLPVKPWQVEDYRNLSTQTLLKRLRQLGIHLKEEEFLAYAQPADSPEELNEAIWGEAPQNESFDQVYLLMFELWRRLLPHKQSISILCDELDHLINLYDREDLKDDDELQARILELQRILDEQVDQGEKPQKVFQTVLQFSAHDLEGFLYDYMEDQIDQEKDLFASELIDGFYEYFQDPLWLDFLRLRLLINTDEEAADAMLRRILNLLQEDSNLDLLFEIARFLIHRGRGSFFVQTCKIMRPCLKKEDDFKELLIITAEFYELLDQKEDAMALQKILKKRQNIPVSKEIASQDTDIKWFYSAIQNLDRDEI